MLTGYYLNSEPIDIDTSAHLMQCHCFEMHNDWKKKWGAVFNSQKAQQDGQ